MTLHLVHRWVSVAVDDLSYIYVNRYTGLKAPGRGTPITEVLQACSIPGCAKLRTKTLDGTWTLEQVRSRT